MKIAPKNSDTQLENVKSQFERNGTEQSQKKQKNGNANRNLFDLRFFAFSFLVARLMVNHHNHCQLLEKYFNRKLASLSLFLDSLAPAVYWLDMILNFHIGYDTNATQHWIGFRNRLNTNRHRYICIVTVESKRWIKHKWTRECHKNQSLKTTHTHTVFVWRNFSFALNIWLLFYQFDHLHISYLSISKLPNKNQSYILALNVHNDWFHIDIGIEGQRTCTNKLKRKVK